MSLPPLNAPVRLSYRLTDSLSEETLLELEAKRDEKLALLEAEKAELESRSDLLALAKKRVQVLANYEAAIEKALLACSGGELDLKTSSVRDFVIRSWQNLHDRGLIDLIAVCVFRKHVHVIVQAPEDEKSLSVTPVMNAHRMYTTHKAKQLLDLNFEDLWEKDYFHCKIRRGNLPEELTALMNRPVEAGFVKVRSKWPGTYVNPEFRKFARKKAA